MSKYKNTLMIFAALIMFIYAGVLSILPKVLSSTFDIDKFEEKFYEATSLLTTVDSVNYKMKWNFETTIIVRNLSLKYIDHQPLLDVKYAQIVAPPSIIFGNNFNIKSMYLKNVVYADQILPNGHNKIAFLPEAFDSKKFGKNNITISPSDIRVKSLKVTYVTPRTYKEKSYREKTFYKEDVRNFLKSLVYSSVKIK